MNNKSIFERLNSIKNRGPERWLSRSLREDATELGRQDSRLMMSQSPKRTDVPTEKPQTSVTTGTEGGSSGEDRSERLDFDNVAGHIRGVSRKAVKAREQLAEPMVQERIQGMNDAKEQRNERAAGYNREVTDKESAIEFLKQFFDVNPRGKFTHRKINNIDESMAHNMSPAGVPGTRESRQIDYDQIQSLNDNPELVEALKNNDIQEIQRMSLRNKMLGEDGQDISFAIAREIMEEMFMPGLVSQFGNHGAPIPTGELGGAFNPHYDVKHLLDENGEYTGMTNIDKLWFDGRTDPEKMEEYNRHFGGDVTMQRSIHILQKLLLTGGMDPLTGRDEDFLIGPSGSSNSTMDHIFGRSNPNPEGWDGFRKESPMNFVNTMANMNQYKQKLGDNPSDLGNARHLEEIGDDMEKYIAYRMDSPQWGKILDHDKAAEADEEGGGRDEGLPETLEEYLDLDTNSLKNIISAFAAHRPNGLDVRNFGKMAPEPRMKKGEERSEVGYLNNSWRGGRGWSDYEKINPYKASIAAAIHSNPEYKGISQNHIDAMGYDGDNLTASQQKEIRAKQQDWVSENFMNEMRAMSTIYGMGRISNKDFVDTMSSLAGGLFDKLGDMDGVQSLRDAVQNNLYDGEDFNYLSQLDSWFDVENEEQEGLFPIPRSEGAIQEGLDGPSNQWAALRTLNNSSRAQSYLRDDEIEALKNAGVLGDIEL